MVGIHRDAPDEKRAVETLRALVEASSRTMLLPPLTDESDQREINRVLTDEEVAAIQSTLPMLRFLPGDLPLHRIAPVIVREFTMPILMGQMSVRSAAVSAQPKVEIALREASS